MDGFRHPMRAAQCGDDNLRLEFANQRQFLIEAAIARMGNHVEGKWQAFRPKCGMDRLEPLLEVGDATPVGAGKGPENAGPRRRDHHVRSGHQKHRCSDDGKAKPVFQRFDFHTRVHAVSFGLWRRPRTSIPPSQRMISAVMNRLSARAARNT